MRGLETWLCLKAGDAQGTGDRDVCGTCARTSVVQTHTSGRQKRAVMPQQPEGSVHHGTWGSASDPRQERQVPLLV